MAEAPGEVAVVMRDAGSGGAYQGARKAGLGGQWELKRDKRRHRPRRGRCRRGSALQVWPSWSTGMAVFPKCMSTLPVLKSILRRGEDGRDVKNGMTSFTSFKSF